MNSKEKRLIAALLDIAGDRLSNAICSDLPEDVRSMLAPNEWTELDRESHERNGDPEEHNPDADNSWQQDWILMRHFAYVLRAQADMESVRERNVK